MKKFLSTALLLTLVTILLTGCFLLGGQKAVQNIELKGLKTEYEIGDTPDFSGVTATVVYNDGTTKEVAGSELTFGTIDTSASGKKSLDVTYEGFTVSIQITVKDKSINNDDQKPEDELHIISVELPSSLTSLESKKELFLNKKYGYVVGDDNPFILKLNLTVINNSGIPVEGFSEYVSVFEIYLDGTLLEGDQLNAYAVIDGAKNSVDFTEEAIGKTFTIKTRPEGIDEEDKAEMTRELTVSVVDGLNIYEAWELNYITNYDEFNFEGVAGINMTHTQIADAFLATKGATRPSNLAGIILHNDLIIERTDIPSEYFLDNNRDNELWDALTIFPHINDSATKTFSIYGNYFTIFSYNLPTVCENGTGNQDDYVSNGQLFRFSAPTDDGVNHDHTQYKLNINSLYLKDDDSNSDNVETSSRDMLGLIGMKVIYQDVTLENVRLEAFYISFFIDGDQTVATLNETKLYNSWQNHIYIWSTNTIQGGTDEAPSENYVSATLNVTNSEITKCGGPVIIAQTQYAEYASGAKSGAVINIDENTEIWTLVTGQEAWFKAMYATPIAQQIQQLGYVLQGTLGTSFITQIGEDGQPSGGTVYMNIVFVNLSAGTDVETILGATEDLDGKVTIAGTTYMNMNDDFTATHAATGKPVGFGNANVANLVAMTGGAAPVFTTAPGGVCYFDGSALQTALTGDPNMDAMNQAALTMGDYIAVHMNNMGILLGYNIPFGG